MAEASGTQPSTKTQILNDRTYQEVEYLKKNLGPILVAALAEICIRRPADPIEYLGHWLLRWRYNEELKRRDVQNALEVVRQKAWSKDDGTMPEGGQPATPQSFTQGFTPATPFGPPGFGGPLDAAAIEQPTADEGEEEEAEGEGEEGEEEGVEKIPSGEGKRPSGEATDLPKRASAGDAKKEGSGDIKRTSTGGGSKKGSQEIKRLSQSEEPKVETSGPVEGGEAPAEAPAEPEVEKRASRKSDADANPPPEAAPPAEEAPASAPEGEAAAAPETAEA